MASLNLSPSNFVVKETARLTWPINVSKVMYNLGVTVQSPLFSPPNSRNEFQFKLHFSADTKITFVLTYKGPKKDGCFHYRVSMLDADEKKHHTQEHRWNYCETVCKSNYTDYISYKQFCNFMFRNFKIFCEVDIFEEYSQFESFGKLSDNYEALFESGKLADFIVLIGDKEFRVHKTILAARSEVFAVMFEHKETQEVKEGRVVIEDIEVNVFELLIRYIYTGKVDKLGEHAAELFVAADKYQLDHLKCICERSLISSLTLESVCGVFLLSDMHNAEQLKSQCTEYIVKHAKEVMLTEGWKELINSNRIDLVVELFAKLTIKEG